MLKSGTTAHFNTKDNELREQEAKSYKKEIEDNLRESGYTELKNNQTEAMTNIKIDATYPIPHYTRKPEEVVLIRQRENILD